MTSPIEITTPARTITEADIVRFAGLTGDFAALHLDEEYAKTTQFGTRIIHGWGTMAIASGLVVQSGLLDDHLAFLGSSFRLRHPVFPGDTIRAEVREGSVRLDSTGQREVVGFQYTVFNQNDETIAEGEWMSLRPPQQDSK